LIETIGAFLFSTSWSAKGKAIEHRAINSSMVWVKLLDSGIWLFCFHALFCIILPNSVRLGANK